MTFPPPHPPGSASGHASDPEGLRAFLRDSAFAVADAMPEIVSLNLVGTFATTGDLRGISDIDVVVILDHLNAWSFEKVMERFRAIGPELLAAHGMTLRINNTFGPLKYDEPGQVVFHVMAYDIARHAAHCRESPFTCLDWQRSEVYRKRPLAEIHPVYRLMPNHFTHARRGVSEYLADYTRGVVSYRAYAFVDGEVLEERHEKPMSVKDRYEFVFHILRFTMGNLLKLLENRNETPPLDQLPARFGRYLPGDSSWLHGFFQDLRRWKQEQAFPDSPSGLRHLDQGVRRFLDETLHALASWFPEDRGRIWFVRHARTPLNRDGLFLGQGLDPAIAGPVSPFALGRVDRVYASPALRARQTAAGLWPGGEARVDARLSEIHYGQAEGHDLAWLRSAHPEVPAAWARGDDAPFPQGECQRDVLARIDAFCRLPDESAGNALVVTHNVWLRCLIGRALGVPMSRWHRIHIPHLRPLAFRRLPDGAWVPDLSADDLACLLSEGEVERLVETESQHDPHARERQAFWWRVFSGTASPRALPPGEGTCLVPMAGEGARFQAFGFTTPKPLIRVEGARMIERAVADLPPMRRAVYLVRSAHRSGALEATLSATAPEVRVVSVGQLTEGQACTCRLGLPEADPGLPLLIAPCDNGMQWSAEKWASLIGGTPVDVVCWTFTRHLAIPEKPEAWGYVDVDRDNRVQRVSVKKPFTADPYSEHCVVGTFWFRTAALFDALSLELIGRNLRVNGEFYVDSLVGLAAEKGLDVRIFDVDHYMGWGKPEDLFEYRKWIALHRVYGKSP